MTDGGEAITVEGSAHDGDGLQRERGNEHLVPSTTSAGSVNKTRSPSSDPLFLQIPRDSPRPLPRLARRQDVPDDMPSHVQPPTPERAEEDVFPVFGELGGRAGARGGGARVEVWGGRLLGHDGLGCGVIWG